MIEFLNSSQPVFNGLLTAKTGWGVCCFVVVEAGAHWLWDRWTGARAAGETIAFAPDTPTNSIKMQSQSQSLHSLNPTNRSIYSCASPNVHSGLFAQRFCQSGC